jgi:RIO kinase 1
VYENVLFMDLVLDDQGAPAPRLADLTYTAEQAAHVHWDVFMQVKRLLETGQIHGDLSAYNVLMSAQGPTIIDLPQVVDVVRNNNARDILRRDLRNVTEHLARYDARLLRFADCGQVLFEHLQYGTLDMVTAPQEGAQRLRGGGGRRGRDAERGRAGRDKTTRAEAPRVDAAPRRQAPARGVQVRSQPASNRGRPDQIIPTERAPRQRRGPR